MARGCSPLLITGAGALAAGLRPDAAVLATPGRIVGSLGTGAMIFLLP